MHRNIKILNKRLIIENIKISDICPNIRYFRKIQKYMKRKISENIKNTSYLYTHVFIKYTAKRNTTLHRMKIILITKLFVKNLENKYTYQFDFEGWNSQF